MTNKEKVLTHLEKEIAAFNLDHLSNCKWNLMQLKKEEHNFSGCLLDFGLVSFQTLCVDDELGSKKEKKQQCKECWEKALSEG